MRLLEGVHRRKAARKAQRTREAIHAALDEACADAGTAAIDVARDRVIVFSDQHKGAGDGADDFLRCRRTYDAALAYYHRLGFHLMELGDVEELWENRIDEVVAQYETTLRLAARFHAAGRYTRFVGNHDMAWGDRALFEARLGPLGYAGAVPLQALRLQVLDGGADLGELLLVHGHQGTADSDRNAWFSRLVVRFTWRPLQRFFNRPWNTPSVDWALRGTHAKDMAAWAHARRRVLVAGHTHLPVFYGSSDDPAAPPPSPPPGTDPERAAALAEAWARWAEAEAERLRKHRPPPLPSPCYFNTGCCSFGDGDITGIELEQGEIRLVKWPSAPDTDRIVLAAMPLAEVFRQVGAAGG